MLKTFQILGYSAGIPTQDRGVTCVMITTQDYNIMIDCGEGSYLRWQKAGYKWKNLKYIIITHMHQNATISIFIVRIDLRKNYAMEFVIYNNG